jgi:flagellar motor component MotA
MRDNTRLLATLIIWAAFTIIIGIIGAMLVTAEAVLDTGGTVALLIILLALLAVVGSSTQAVWGARSADDADEQTRRAKDKRTGRSRMERLIEALDDDEIYDLESLLLSREESAARHKEP